MKKAVGLFCFMLFSTLFGFSQTVIAEQLHHKDTVYFRFLEPQNNLILWAGNSLGDKNYFQKRDSLFVLPKRALIRTSEVNIKTENNVLKKIDLSSFIHVDNENYFSISKLNSSELVITPKKVSFYVSSERIIDSIITFKFEKDIDFSKAFVKLELKNGDFVYANLDTLNKQFFYNKNLLSSEIQQVKFHSEDHYQDGRFTYFDTMNWNGINISLVNEVYSGFYKFKLLGIFYIKNLGNCRPLNVWILDRPGYARNGYITVPITKFPSRDIYEIAEFLME